MKKVFKSFLAVIIAVATIVAPVLTVFAETVPESIHVVTTPPQPGNSWYIENLYVGNKTITGGGVAYCLNYHLNTPLDTTVTLKNEMDAGMAYIIENGFPNKSITGNNDKDYYITQVAVWWYLDETTGSDNLSAENKASNSEVVPYIRSLVTGAIDAKNRGYKNPTISASINNNNLVINGEYFKSEEITVNTTDVDTYTVELVNAPSGSYTADLEGNKKETFNASEKFVVYVPANSVGKDNSSFTVKLVGNGKAYKVYEYLRQNDGEQNILPSILYPTELTTNTELALNVYPEIEVPNTGSNLILMYIIGSLLIITGLVFVRSYAKDNK